ncbi:MAG: hypothetical protein QXS20_08235 [Candidatus Thorarchaeota archaeon]
MSATTTNAGNRVIRELDPRLLRIAGLGGVLGSLAALLGLVSAVNSDLVPVGSVYIIGYLAEVLVTRLDSAAAGAVFFALLGVGALLQYPAFRRVALNVGSGMPNAVLAAGIMGIVATVYHLVAYTVNTAAQVQVINYASNTVLIGFLFIVAWQISSSVYVDTSKSYAYMIAGICNALFIPLLGLGIDGLEPAGNRPGPWTVNTSIFAAYAVLAVGQLLVVKYWWGGPSHIREYARSTPAAKLGFTLSGLLVFLVGLVPLSLAVRDVSGLSVWVPWGQATTYGFPDSMIAFETPPWKTLSALSLMLFWLSLAPRLGAGELKLTKIRSDIISGGMKYFLIVLAVMGIMGGCFSGSLRAATAGSYGALLTVAPAAVLFIVGAAYVSNTDVVSGLPLVTLSMFLMVLPSSLATITTTLWILCIVTHSFLVIETKLRGFTFFSQPMLTVIVSVAASLLFVLFILGQLGTGPPAIWPANRWFNIDVLPGVDEQYQGPSVFAMLFTILMIRNVASVGLGRGRELGSGGVLIIISLLFMLGSTIVSSNAGLTHQALTAAALMFMFYTISFPLMLSTVISIGNAVSRANHEFEGTLMRVGSVAAMVFGVIVVLFAFSVFSVTRPLASDVALAVALMVSLVVSTEILQIFAWLSAGVRFRLLTQGLRFSRSAT